MLVPTKLATDLILLVLGLFQVITGAAILLVPHILAQHLFEHWVAQPLLTGTVMVIAGGMLLWVRLLPVRQPVVIFGGLGLTIAIFAYQVFATLGEIHAPHWHWTVLFGAMTLTTVAVAGFMARFPDTFPAWGDGRGFNLGAVMAQVVALTTGLLMIVLAKAAYSGPAYAGFHYNDQPGVYLLFALGFIILGAVLLVGTLIARGWWELVLRTGNSLLAVLFLGAAVGFARQQVYFGAIAYVMLSLCVIDLGPLAHVVVRPSLGMNSARRRVALATTTLFVAAALILQVVQTTRQEASTRAAVEADTLALARATAGQVDQFISSLATGLDIMEDVIEIAPSFTSDEALALLQDQADEYDGLSYVAVVDPNGRELLRTDDGVLQDLSSDPVVVAGAGQRQMGLGSPVTDPATGELVIHIVYGVFDEARNPMGAAVVGTVPVARIGELLAGTTAMMAGADEGAATVEQSGTEASHGQETMIFDAQGNLVYHPDWAELPPDAYRDNPALAAALTGSTGFTRYVGWEGSPEVSGYSPIGELGWAALVEQAEHDTLAGLYAAREISFLLLIALSVVMAGASLIIARLLLKPAADLVSPVMAFGRGEFDVALPHPDDSEIGTLTTAFGRMRDEIRIRERELAATNVRLEDANQTRANFLRTMSEELRSPMNDVLGYAHLLLDGLDGDLTPQQAADVGQIAESADGLLALINNVIDYSRLDAGWAGNPPTEVEIAPIAVQVRNQFALEAAEKGIEILVDTPSSLPAAWTDPVAVNQILTNLVGNAVKFTERGRISITARATPDGMTIAVVDTGIGIPEETLGAIFDAFQQGDSSTTRAYRGAGLGLAIARKLAALQHGRIEVESRVGIGSTFTVTLPLAHPEQVTMPAPMPMPDLQPQLSAPMASVLAATVAVSAPVLAAPVPSPAVAYPVTAPVISRPTLASQTGRLPRVDRDGEGTTERGREPTTRPGFLSRLTGPKSGNGTGPLPRQPAPTAKPGGTGRPRR